MKDVAIQIALLLIYNKLMYIHNEHINSWDVLCAANVFIKKL